MVGLEKGVKAYAYDSLREYIVYNNIEVKSKDDLTKIFVVMHDKGYFYKAVVNNLFDEVKSALKEFANYYEKDNSILEKDLVFFGSRRVIEKIESALKEKNSQKR